MLLLTYNQVHVYANKSESWPYDLQIAAELKA